MPTHTRSPATPAGPMIVGSSAFFCKSNPVPGTGPLSYGFEIQIESLAAICTHIRFPAIAEGTSAQSASTCRGNPCGCPPAERGHGGSRLQRKSSEGEGSQGRKALPNSHRGASGVPPQDVGAEPAPAKPEGLPCCLSGRFAPRPPSPLRPAPSQLRLVCLFHPFQSPPTGPSASHPAHAWQLRLVSLCRLVRRTSNRIWTAIFQARPAGKKRSHNSIQLKPRRFQARRPALTAHVRRR